MEEVQIFPEDSSEEEIANDMIPIKEEHVLRLMTYNVQEWLNDDFHENYSEAFLESQRTHRDIKKYVSGKEIQEVIEALNPDVLGIQETSNSKYSQKQHTQLERNYHSYLAHLN